MIHNFSKLHVKFAKKLLGTRVTIIHATLSALHIVDFCRVIMKCQTIHNFRHTSGVVPTQ